MFGLNNNSQFGEPFWISILSNLHRGINTDNE